MSHDFTSCWELSTLLKAVRIESKSSLLILRSCSPRFQEDLRPIDKEILEAMTDDLDDLLADSVCLFFYSRHGAHPDMDPARPQRTSKAFLHAEVSYSVSFSFLTTPPSFPICLFPSTVSSSISFSILPSCLLFPSRCSESSVSTGLSVCKCLRF